MKKLFFSFLLLTSVARGEIPGDKLKHIGVSYAIQTVNYEIWKAITNDDKPGSLVMAAVTTLMIGVTKEMVDACKPRGEFSGSDMLANGLGTGLAVGTTLVFEW